MDKHMDEARTGNGSSLNDLLAKARDEIRSLRRANEVLSAKVEVMDLFACVLHTTPATRGHGEGEDVAWALQTKIDELAEEEGE